MDEHTRAAPRLMTAAAIALVVAALAAFAYLAGGGVAGAADTSGGGIAASSGQLRPVQESGDENAPPERGGHPCPEEVRGSGSDSDSGSGSGEQTTPGTATPDTQL